MSKLAKTVGKWKLWLIIGAVLAAAGILVAAIFGFNADATVADSKTLTVKMNSYAYEMRLDDAKKICEAELDKAGLKNSYTLYGEMSGDSDELVYVFASKTDSQKLTAAGDAIQAKFDQVTAESGNPLEGAELLTTVNTEAVASALTNGYLWRGIVAAAVILAIEFVYIAVRYKLNMGLTAAATSLLSLLLTVSVIALARVPVTASVIYVAAFAMLYTTLLAMFSFNKMRENFKTDDYKNMSAEEAIVSSMPVKTILVFAAAASIALVLVGAVAVANVRWFALAALIATVLGTASVLLFMPAMYLPLKKLSDKKEAERARYDYKKGAKKDKEKTEKETSAENASSEA